MGLIQLDAHTDTVDNIAGDKICHSTPIRRAVEDGCIIPEKTVQIGIRGGGYSMDYVQWGIDQVSRYSILNVNTPEHVYKREPGHASNAVTSLVDAEGEMRLYFRLQRW